MNPELVLVVKKPPANAGDIRETDSTPGWERSPGGGHGNAFLYSCLENPMDKGAWQPIVHRVAKSWTWLKWLNTEYNREETLYQCWVQFSYYVMSNFLQPHDCSTPGLPVCPSTTLRACSNSCPWIGDAIQLSHPLPSPSLLALSLSQHQGLFQWVSSSHQVAKVLIAVSASASALPMNIQD